MTPEQVARDLLKNYWNGTIPVDPVKIANAAKVAVMAEPDLGAESGHYLPTSGESNSPLIKFNPYEAVVRQRFTIAHELGHHCLGHGERPRDTSKQFTMSSDPAEVVANKFAANLLMPADAVHALIRVEGITSVSALAERFHVSKAAMKFRVESLGYVVQ